MCHADSSLISAPSKAVPMLKKENVLRPLFKVGHGVDEEDNPA